MEEAKQNQLGMRLKKMLDDFFKEETRRKHRITPSGTGNIIRRREGQKEKRFSLTHPKYGTAAARGNQRDGKAGC